MDRQIYPMCEKWAKACDKNGALAILEFMDWLLNTQGIQLSSYTDPDSERLMPLYTKAEDFVFDFFGIDKFKLEKERSEMLKSLQN